MAEREPTDLTEFVDLPLFGSAVAAPSGNSASPEPAPDEPEAVTPADRDGSDAAKTPPGARYRRRCATS